MPSLSLFLFIQLITTAFSQLCTLPDSYDIQFSICNGASVTTGTLDDLSVQFCQKNNQCVTQVFSGPFEAGQTYDFSLSASLFTDQVLEISVSKETGTQDGVCLESFTFWGEELLTTPFFLDDPAGCQDSAEFNCPCGQHPTGSVIFKCQAWEGSTDLNLLIEDEQYITDIPAGVSQLVISLEAGVDLDLKLYVGFSSDRGECLAGYSCLHGLQGVEQIFTYDGSEGAMTITFSGDMRIPDPSTGLVTESIEIDTVTNPLSLYVRAYATGSGTVSYSWANVEDDCDFDNYNCEDCSAYTLCKDGDMPICDGSDVVRCVSPTVAPTERLICDAYQTVLYDVTDCIESYTATRNECTETPTSTPSSSIPTRSPSGSPDTSMPTNTPSFWPTISLPTRTPSGEPTFSAPSRSPVIPPRCEKAEEFDVVIHLCDDDTAGSDYMSLSATFCDVDDVCRDIMFDPQPNTPGQVYTYDLTSTSEWIDFTDHMDRVTFKPDSNDGLCVDYMKIGNSTFTDGPYWFDQTCEGTSGTCTCDEFQESNVIFTCTAYEGSSDIVMNAGALAWVTNIPVNVTALNITLISDVDFDLQLFYGWDDNLGSCFVGYDCDQWDFTKTQELYGENMVVIFSGDDRDAPVVENLLITKVEFEISLWVRAYGSGAGRVEYVWDGIEPCNFERFGCAPCNDFAGCKDGDLPVCDGTADIVCVDPSLQVAQQAECDGYSEEDADEVCSDFFQLEFCDSWAPTVSPSNTPTVQPSNLPSGTPTVRPDCWHFKLGECGCPDGLPVDIAFILDASGSIGDTEFSAFTEAIGAYIQNTYPDTGRLAAVSYSTQSRVVFPFMDGRTKQEWGEDVAALESIGGATWTRRALTSTWYDVWEPYLNAYPEAAERLKETIILTDGAPSYLGTAASQSPCDTNGDPIDVVPDEYWANGITIQRVAVGDWQDIASDSLACLNEDAPIHFFNSLDDPDSILSVTFDNYLAQCAWRSESEYNGRYSVVLDEFGEYLTVDGKYVYQHSENWRVHWGGEGFEFFDPNGVLRSMQETHGDITAQLDYKYPRNGSDYQYNAAGGAEPRPMQIICCNDIPAPSRTPSVIPTQAPIEGTRPPTISTPSMTPTTSIPSTSPDTSTPTTAIPTGTPSVSEPTVSPDTSSPSTSRPSLSPDTSSPTTTQPSVGPIIGTYAPTTPQPSTTPSHGPSVFPTTSPDTSRPTVTPSVSPSTIPSFNPTHSVPTTSPSSSMPTPGPTTGPTTSPTTPPSPSPTSAPSPSPTYAPTNAPSGAPTKWDCIKQETLTVTLTICSDPPTAGSADAVPLATFYDCHGLPGTFDLYPGDAGATGANSATGSTTYLPGESYTWVLPTDQFSDQVIDVTLSLESNDGLCISEFTVVSRYWNDPTGTIHTNEMITDKHWLDDAQCTANNNDCECGYYQVGVVFQCQAWSGTTDVNMVIGDETWVTYIPTNVQGLTITLESDVDLDLRLYTCSVYDDYECQTVDTCLVGYDCENSQNGTINYGGMEIEYYGDDREAPINETISISSTVETMALYVKAFRTGTGTISYSWDEIDPCTAESAIGCYACSEYLGCKDGTLPVCFGSGTVDCVDSNLRAESQAACDDYSSSDVFSCGSVDLDLRECVTPPTVSPTVGPSNSPTTSLPTMTPSTVPTSSIPSQSPTTSKPTFEPTRFPTVRLPCVKQETYIVEITFCDEVTAGSTDFQLSATLTDHQRNTATIDLGATQSPPIASVNPGQTYWFNVDMSSFTGQIIEMDLSTTSNDGFGISSIRVTNNNGELEARWNDLWVAADITCVWLDNTCDPLAQRCKCGEYPNDSQFCQDWVQTSDINMRFGNSLWIADIPLGSDITNVEVNMTSTVDFDLKLYDGHYAEFAEEDRNAQRLADNAVCYLGYACQYSAQDTHVITQEGGTTEMTIIFSGDVRDSVDGSVYEKFEIPESTFAVSMWVRAWNTGSGSVSWTWDGLEDCGTVVGTECRACNTFDCGELSAVCFGGYLSDFTTTGSQALDCDDDNTYQTLQNTCDNYGAAQFETQGNPNGVCDTVEVEMPLCTTDSPTQSPSSSIPSRSPTPQPATSMPSRYPTESPSAPCCDEVDIITGTVTICGTFGECTPDNEPDCEAVSIPTECSESNFETFDPTHCLGSCFWANDQCNEWSTAGSDYMTVDMFMCDVKNNCATLSLSPPWAVGEVRSFSWDAKAAGIPFQVTEMDILIDNSGPLADDGVCIADVNIQFDLLDYNNQLLEDEELWLDGNCGSADDAECPCDAYVMENVTYKCQVWDGNSVVYMTPGQNAWITDIPEDVVDVIVNMTTSVNYDLYAITQPTDYVFGSGTQYDFDTANSEILLFCLGGSTCAQPVEKEGMTVTYREDSEEGGSIQIDRTTEPVVIYVKGREVGSTFVNFYYESEEFCSADLQCAPCDTYECKDGLDTVCNGQGLPFCGDSFNVDTTYQQAQCDNSGNECSTTITVPIDPCEDCYTNPPSISPSTPLPSVAPVTTTLEPSTMEPTTTTFEPTEYDDCSCYTPTTVQVIVTLCENPASAGTQFATPEIELCDNEGVCNTYALDPPADNDSLEAGETYAWIFPPSAVTPYTDFLITSEIVSASSDGFCIESWSVNGYDLPLDDEDDTATEFWVDGDCTGHTNECACGFYPEGSIQYSCDVWEGQSTMDLYVSQEVFVSTIPENVRDLVITLTSAVDLDLQLYDGDTCIAGYNCQYGSNAVFVYEGMTINFTGDVRNDPVVETIEIDVATRPLTLNVKAYGNGEGVVTYGWSGIEPCPSDGLGCSLCSAFIGCKDNDIPVCDGSADIICVDQGVASVQQASCDDYDPANYFPQGSCSRTKVPFPECNTCYPTVVPTPMPHTTVPSTAPTPMPHTTVPSVAPTPYPHTSVPSGTPSTPPTPMPHTSVPSVRPSVSPSTPLPTSTPSPVPFTSNPSVRPSITPTTPLPSWSPITTTIEPTICPRVCIFDCDDTDACTERCDQEVIDAENAKDAECEDSMLDLKNRVDQAEEDVDELNTTCTECEDLNINVELLVQILSDDEIQTWNAVVASGVSCSYVSTIFCSRVTGCFMNGDVCDDTTARPSIAPVSTEPSIAPVVCASDTDAWQDVVDTGTLCVFVPLDACDDITQCELNSDNDACQNRLSGSVVIDAFDLTSLTNRILIDFPALGGTVTFFVSESNSQTISDAAGPWDCTATPVSQSSEVTFSESCQFQGGICYYVYGHLQLTNGQESLLGPEQFCIPYPSIVTSDDESTTDFLNFEWQVTNHNDAGSAYFEIIDNSGGSAIICTMTENQGDFGESAVRQGFPCLALSGGWTYDLDASVDIDGSSQTSALAESTTTIMTFTVPSPALTEAVYDGSESGYSMDWSVENAAETKGGRVYWVVVSTSVSTAYTDASLIYAAMSGGDANVACYDSAAQNTDTSNTYTSSGCTLNAGVSYQVYFALDIDGNGLDLVNAGLDSIVIPSLVGSVSVYSASTEGYVTDITLNNPSAGSVYYLTTDMGTTLTAQEVIDQASALMPGAICGGRWDQAASLTGQGVYCPTLLGGVTYLTWLAVDQDSNGNGPLLLSDSGTAVVVDSPTMTLREITNPTTTGFSFGYYIGNTNPDGDVYWGVAPMSGTRRRLDGVTAQQVMDEELICSGSASQVDAGVHYVNQFCTLEVGVTYEFFGVTDTDGQGTNSYLALTNTDDKQFFWLPSGAPSSVPSHVPTQATILTFGSFSYTGYNGVAFSYSLINSVPGNDIYYSIERVGVTAPTTVSEVQSGSCSGSFTQVDDLDTTMSISSCTLTAATEYVLYFATPEGNIYAEEFDSSNPTLTIDDSAFDATTSGFNLRYQVTNPAFGSGLVYYYVRSPSSDLVFPGHITGCVNNDGGISQAPLCCGTVPQEETEEYVTVAVACSNLLGGETYAVHATASVKSDSGDTINPIEESMTLPDPTASSSVSDVSQNGFTLTYVVANPGSGNLYYAVVLAGETLTTTELVSQSGLCAGSVVQGTGTASVSCILESGSDYELVTYLEDDSAVDESTFSVPVPEISLDFGEIDSDGFDFDMTVTDAVSGAGVAIIVTTLSLSDSEATQAAQNIGSFDSTCSLSGLSQAEVGGLLTGCGFDLDTTYFVYVVGDLNTAGSEYVADTYDIRWTSEPTLAPTGNPTLNSLYDCTSETISDLIGSCFDQVQFTCEACCNTDFSATDPPDECWVGQYNKDSCCVLLGSASNVTDASGNTVIVSDPTRRRRN